MTPFTDGELLPVILCSWYLSYYFISGSMFRAPTSLILTFKSSSGSFTVKLSRFEEVLSSVSLDLLVAKISVTCQYFLSKQEAEPDRRSVEGVLTLNIIQGFAEYFIF